VRDVSFATFARLEDLVTNGEISYGIVQPGYETASGVPIVRVKDIRDGRINQTSVLRVDPEISDRHGRTVLEGGELLVTIVGTVGESAVVPKELAGWNVARAIAVVRPLGVSAQWIRLCLETSGVKQALGGVLNTTVQSTLNLADLKRLLIPVPPVRDREAIAEVLGALDEKIAASTSIVDASVNLATAIYAGALQHDGLESVRLDSMAEHLPGKYLPKEAYAAGGIYRVYGSNSDMGSHAEALYPGGFTVLARIGSYCGSLRWSQRPAWVNNNASALLPVGGFDPWVLRHALARVDMEPHRGGSGQPFIRVDSLMSSVVAVPSYDIRRGIAPVLQDLAERETLACESNRILAAMRDALLPPLMSGRIRVKDAEQMVGDVA